MQEKRHGERVRAASALIRHWWIYAIVAGSAFYLATLSGCGASFILAPSPAVPADTVSQIAGSPIDHIVIIMQENRTFDNLFNGFPGADTVQSGISKGMVVPLTPIGLDDKADPDHSHKQWWRAWNYGSMDGFAENGMGSLPYSYVPEKDDEAYWTLARNYTVGDRMFQSNTGPSFAAHQYMIAARAGDVAENPSGGVWGCEANSNSTDPLIGPNGTELPGVYPCFDYKTAADLLDEKGVSWRYYAPGDGNSFFILSAYQAIRHIRYGNDWKQNVISPQNRVLVDIAHGELAQVTWIVPDWTHSDHPGSKSSEGPDWVASVVNAIGQSQYWNSTAIFITWDDWGGWYDHVDPPKIDAMGPGFRVPLIVVSPYARRGYVSHHFHEVGGLVAFIEKNFALGTLGGRDNGSEAFADCFDYTQKPAPYSAVASKVTPDVLVHEEPSGPADEDDY